jgi:hypothetical protein
VSFRGNVCARGPLKSAVKMRARRGRPATVRSRDINKIIHDGDTVRLLAYLEAIKPNMDAPIWRGVTGHPLMRYLGAEVWTGSRSWRSSALEGRNVRIPTYSKHYCP